MRWGACRWIVTNSTGRPRGMPPRRVAARRLAEWRWGKAVGRRGASSPARRRRAHSSMDGEQELSCSAFWGGGGREAHRRTDRASRMRLSVCGLPVSGCPWGGLARTAVCARAWRVPSTSRAIGRRACACSEMDLRTRGRVCSYFGNECEESESERPAFIEKKTGACASPSPAVPVPAALVA